MCTTGTATPAPTKREAAARPHQTVGLACHELQLVMYLLSPAHLVCETMRVKKSFNRV
jgi:hypothetical protein